ncbi:transposase [Flavobacterium gelidilacus]|uniref:transposase n=1 Tax=Flavobacterium gelidilacus TaxID=206041 RepID=UPI0004239D86|nr:transposase [Flavobacterium gelidilacus]
MSKNYKNKYRIESLRLKNWDYRNNGAYFITICTGNRKHYFGEIENNNNQKIMLLNEIGTIAENFWLEIPNHFPFVELGNFVVMPNHIHGILIINSLQNDNLNLLQCNDSNEKPSMAINESLQCNDSTNTYFSKISPKPGSVSTIIRSYKSVVTKNARLINSDFNWQSKFYDIIIKNSISFERIQTYIENNPSNWKEDKFYN